MITVKIFKDNAWYLAGITTAVNFENCKKQLSYYFTNIIKVKERIIAGEIIDSPYLTLQRDRGVNEENRIKNDWRRHFNIPKRGRTEAKVIDMKR